MATTTWVVEIDQTAIAAPGFPRAVEWWRGYLPLWFSTRRWWEKSDAECQQGKERIRADGSSLVTIDADDRAHASEIVKWLRDSALRRFVADPESCIRAVGRSQTGVNAA